MDYFSWTHALACAHAFTAGQESGHESIKQVNCWRANSTKCKFEHAKKIRLNLILKKRCFVLYSSIIHDVCLVCKNLLLNSWAVLTSLFAKTDLLVFDNQKFEFEVNLKVVIKNSWNGDEQETNWAKCECCCFKGFGVRNGSGEPLRKDIIGAVSDRFCDLLS